MNSPTTKQPRIQALARASAIIDVIAQAGEQGAALTDISRITELNKTTAFNLLASLVTLRFIDQEAESRRYVLGLRNIELGRIAQRRLHIPSVARPLLAELCRISNETVSLAIPDHNDLLVVDSLQGSQLLHATSYTGSRSLYHCTGLGKAVMSQWDSSRRHDIYNAHELVALTPHSITDIDTLEAQLATIKQRGYAFDLEENEVGLSCVATTIKDGFGEVVAAVSVTGPTSRMTTQRLEKISTDLVDTARKISTALQTR